MKGQNSNGPLPNREQCAHSHRHGGRKKAQELDELLAPPSPIQEEQESDIEPEPEADILVITDDSNERPRTGRSRVSSAVSSRPASRMLSRPESSRSTFESMPGTRPASRRVGHFLNLKS